MKDFEEYLRSDSPHLKRALTDRSHRKYTNDHTLPFNDYLSTLGDAVLRLCLTDLLSGGDGVSIARQPEECNESLASVIARHYGLLEGKLLYDKNDPTKGKGYDWDRNESRSIGNNRKHNPQKYLADAVEALLGAYYLDRDRDMVLMNELVSEWMELITKSARVR